MFKLFKHNDDDSSSWEKPELIPKEVLSKSELDALERQTIDTLQKEGVLHPHALRYVYKFIDAKFDKNNFDIDTAFAKKQSVIDSLYAEGMSDVYSMFTGYQELVAETRAAEENLKRWTKALDPDGAEVATTEYDDSEKMLAELKALPSSLKWNND